MDKLGYSLRAKLAYTIYGELLQEAPSVAYQREQLQDARYVIHTITFFAVSCPENSAFFRKNRQIFENIPRKILHILNILEKCCILEKSRKILVKIWRKFSKILAKFAKFSWKKTAKNSAIFNENFEIRERFQSGAKECIV